MTFLDNEHREIITKAVCGSGEKHTHDSHSVSPHHQPTSILGCWVINHRYQALNSDEKTVEIRGSYDVNIWYSFDDDTKTEVAKETVSYTDEIPLSVTDGKLVDDDEYDIAAKVVQQPNCIECKILDDAHDITVEIDREFAVQIIGETKIVVKVDPYGNQAENGTWGFTLTDETADTELKLGRMSEKN